MKSKQPNLARQVEKAKKEISEWPQWVQLTTQFGGSSNQSDTLAAKSPTEANHGRSSLGAKR